MNLCATVVFAPSSTVFREALGLPEPRPCYLWVLTVWIPTFGLAYAWMGWTGRAHALLLGCGAAGKLVFALIILWFCAAGDLSPRAALIGLPDLTLAIVFIRWLFTYRTGG